MALISVTWALTHALSVAQESYLKAALDLLSLSELCCGCGSTAALLALPAE